MSFYLALFFSGDNTKNKKQRAGGERSDQHKDASVAKVGLPDKWAQQAQPSDGALGVLQFDLHAGVWVRNTSLR